MAVTEPLEFDEECALSDYCDVRHLTHWHVPQETYTASWGIKMKNRRQGVRKGVSDHWVKVKDSLGEYWLINIELKRAKSGTPTDEQLDFLRAMNEIPHHIGVLCHGADEAIAVIEGLEKGDLHAMNRCLMRAKDLEERRKKRKKTQKTAKKSKNKLPY